MILHPRDYVQVFSCNGLGKSAKVQNAPSFPSFSGVYVATMDGSHNGLHICTALYTWIGTFACNEHRPQWCILWVTHSEALAVFLQLFLKTSSPRRWLCLRMVPSYLKLIRGKHFMHGPFGPSRYVTDDVTPNGAPQIAAQNGTLA